MPKSARQKQKILYIAKYLMEETDENHPVTLRDIMIYLQHQGISSERKSLYADIEELRAFGLDVICTKGKTTGYFIGERPFELPEVRLLVDAVQSSRFLTRKKSESLIRKLQTLTSRQEGRAISRSVYVSGRVKTMNESVYHNVDAIGLGMEQKRKLTFRYFEWDVSGNKQYRRGGKAYVVSPWFLIWEDEKYYLVALEEESGEKRHFRVDKMSDISITEEPREGDALFAQVDPGSYESKSFGMYGGREERVTLWCHESLSGVIFDRFGTSLVTRKSGDGFEFSLPVMVSPVFFSWLMGFGDRVCILAPKTVADEFCELARSALRRYEEDPK